VASFVQPFSFHFVLICERFLKVENSLSAPFSQSSVPFSENRKSQTSCAFNDTLFLTPNCQPTSFVCPTIFSFSIIYRFGGFILSDLTYLFSLVTCMAIY